MISNESNVLYKLLMIYINCFVDDISVYIRIGCLSFADVHLKHIMDDYLKRNIIVHTVFATFYVLKTTAIFSH